MRNIFIILVPAILLLSCGNGHSHQKSQPIEETTEFKSFDHDNIVFEIPEGWKAHRQVVSDTMTTVSCEKVGDDESGQFTFAFMKKQVDLNEVLNTSAEKLDEKVAAMGSKVNWQQQTDEAMMGTFRAKTRRFTFTGGDYTFSGFNSAFIACGSTILMSYVEAEEDNKKYAAAYQLVTTSFKCK